MKRETIYQTDREFLPNPVDPLYQTDAELISTSDHVQDLYNEAISLENKIAGDFDLDEVINQVKINSLAFIKTGLLLFKAKQLRLYKQVCKTFNQFCTEHLGMSVWRANRLIRATRVVLELVAHGCHILPVNEAQTRALLTATAGDEGNIVDAWKSITENLEPHQITARTITNHLKPEEKTDPIHEKIVVKRNLFARMQSAALAIGTTIEQLLEEIFQPVIDNVSNYYYQEKLEHWQKDVAKLVSQEPI